jgi:hypothetical protein
MDRDARECFAKPGTIYRPSKLQFRIIFGSVLEDTVSRQSERQPLLHSPKTLLVERSNKLEDH